MSDINSILENTGWVTYKVQKLRNPILLWAHPESSKNLHDGENFCDRFGYADLNAACFDGVGFEVAKNIVVSAERYGGDGIGHNGGGGRCGNVHGVQLKGIGPNCLVGSHDNKVHSYGGLDARKAIVETIYTHVLGKILPLGTVNIRGLILVGEKSGFNGLEDCWGVIMVRDTCMRPGHFLRAGGFIPKQEVKNSLLSDAGRVRRLYKELNGHFRSTNEFIKWIGQHFLNIAQQFSFALASRITHGTMSPSNLSIDGRWLDLPDASFLGGGTRFSIKNEFFSEHQLALKYLLEIVYNYSKYNGLSLNPAPLINYYNEQFDFCFRHYIGIPFGFDIQDLPFISSKDWAQVAATFHRTMHIWKDIVRVECSTSDENDPIYSLVIGSLLHCCNSWLADEILNKTGIPPEELNSHLESFKRIWTQYLQYMGSTNKLQPKAVSIRSLLIALKNILWVEIFYSYNVDEQVLNICNGGAPSEIGPLIDIYLNIANWVFNSDQNIVTLFKNDDIEIWFSVTDCHYCYKAGSSLSVYEDFNKLYCELSNDHPDTFTIKDINYLKHFKILNEIMSSIDFKQ